MLFNGTAKDVTISLVKQTPGLAALIIVSWMFMSNMDARETRYQNFIVAASSQHATEYISAARKAVESQERVIDAMAENRQLRQETVQVLRELKDVVRQWLLYEKRGAP